MHPLRARLVEVVDKQTLSPGLVRITVGSNDLHDFVSLDPNDDMKLAFPQPGQTVPAMPQIIDGKRVWNDDDDIPVLREYTPRRFDQRNGTVSVDFVLHGDGPASNWARAASIGEVIGMFGPKSSRLVDDRFDWYLTVGDETALPSIARRLEEAPPSTRIHAIIEVENPVNEQAIETAADATIIWAYRRGVPAGSSDALEQAIRNAVFPAGSYFAWAGGEATTLRTIRRHLLNERSARLENSRFSGHWKQHVSDYDHHQPLDD